MIASRGLRSALQLQPDRLPWAYSRGAFSRSFPIFESLLAVV
jgi:hypothetical protein